MQAIAMGSSLWFAQIKFENGTTATIPNRHA
jgi:hypothetical protein